VAPTTLDLGMVPLGATNVLPINIQNSGGAPLIVSYMWAGTLSTDFSAAARGAAADRSRHAHPARDRFHRHIAALQHERLRREARDRHFELTTNDPSTRRFPSR